MKLSHTRSLRKIVWVKTRDCKLNSCSFVVSYHTMFIAGIFFKVTPHHPHICIIPSELTKDFLSVFYESCRLFSSRVQNEHLIVNDGIQRKSVTLLILYLLVYFIIHTQRFGMKCSNQVHVIIDGWWKRWINLMASMMRMAQSLRFLTTVQIRSRDMLLMCRQCCPQVSTWTVHVVRLYTSIQNHQVSSAAILVVIISFRN